MKKILAVFKTDWIIWMILFLSFLFSLMFYDKLPMIVQVHWNSHNNWGYWPKLYEVIIIPLSNFLLYIFLVLLSPKRKENSKQFFISYQIAKYIFAILILSIHVIIIMNSLGFKFKVSFYLNLLFAVLLIVLGNFMSRFRFKYRIGFKTPWALSNEDVWKKTHRVAGPVFVMAGVVIFITDFFQNEAVVVALKYLIIGAIVIIPSLYSYIYYKHIT